MKHTKRLMTAIAFLGLGCSMAVANQSHVEKWLLHKAKCVEVPACIGCSTKKICDGRREMSEDRGCCTRVQCVRWKYGYDRGRPSECLESKQIEVCGQAC